MNRAVEIVTEHVRDLIESQGDSFLLTDLRDKTITHFKEHNPDVLLGLMQARMESTVYDIVQKMVAKGRQHLTFPANGHTHKAIKKSRDALREDIAREREQRNRRLFADWYEHTSTGHVALLDMQVEDLRDAQRRRTSRGNQEIAVARWLGRIADRLPLGASVRKHFTDEELIALREERP